MVDVGVEGCMPELGMQGSGTASPIGLAVGAVWLMSAGSVGLAVCRLGRRLKRL